MGMTKASLGSITAVVRSRRSTRSKPYASPSAAQRMFHGTTASRSLRRTHRSISPAGSVARTTPRISADLRTTLKRSKPALIEKSTGLSTISSFCRRRSAKISQLKESLQRQRARDIISDVLTTPKLPATNTIMLKWRDLV